MRLTLFLTAHIGFGWAIWALVSAFMYQDPVRAGAALALAVLTRWAIHEYRLICPCDLCSEWRAERDQE